jgi:uncharacterized repeat protein (TIGR03803 family)
LVEETNGVFYGTTPSGGSNGYGVIFSITSAGDFKSLYSFDYTNGSAPDAGLVFGGDRCLYGTTYSGGESDYGTLFRYNLDGTFTNLHSFNGIDGASPQAPLIEGPNGVFYGTTPFGGEYATGNVFAMTPNGNVTNLHAFDFSTNGANPLAGLVFGPDGAMYGTTTESATVFRVATNGEETTLCTLERGSQPWAPIIVGPDGNFFGEVRLGDGYPGQIIRITPRGILTNLVTFSYYPPIGTDPTGGMIVGPNSGLYGTTENGGQYNCGTVFSVTTNGELSILHSFNGADGAQPQGPLVLGTDGSFYGTAWESGPDTNTPLGVVFKLTITPPGMPSFISSTLTNGAIALKWAVQAGQTYQTQCHYDLMSTNWSNFGGPIFASSDTLTATDSTTNSQRFYRIVPLPE